MSLVSAREDFLARAINRLAGDARVAAVLLTGSGGRGEADDWSDLDIVVVVDDDAASDVLSHPHAAEQFGDLVVWVDCSFNAMPGGSMAFARYASDDVLVLVDWNVWPVSAARLTTGSRLLWCRPDVELPPFDGNVVEFVLSGERRRPPPYSRQQRAEWELCMIHIASARPPRGEDGRRLHQLIGLDEDTGPDPVRQLAGLERHLNKLEPWVTPRALSATVDRLQAARTATLG